MVDSSVLSRAVSLASRAPSLHNTQPWRWVAYRGTLALHLDRRRIVTNTDDAGRQALISCGVMLDHLRVAMAAAGWRSSIHRFPNDRDPDLLATVSFTAADPEPTDLARADAILHRRTDRLPLLAPTDWTIVEAAVQDLLDGPDGVDPAPALLDTLAEELRPDLSRAASLTEAIRRFDSAYQRDLDWWTTPFEYTEGIPRTALTSVDESDRVEVNRSFPVEGRGHRRPGVGEDQAQILLLSTGGDTAADALGAGEALSRVLLECTVAGLATCPVTHVTELPEVRSAIAAVTAVDTVPQALIRVGQIPGALTENPAITPRRPVAEILRFAG
ncbi:Acg family FMN-binding oxidoreductase [Mycolicibacterium fallax]|uniref:NAD(P)H nitroreductase n=1 Tax=Mycolicibacterium fallax TaxID=1793 RepID=A0A1X1RF33_MYCFA|nr:NAD(P)H nitroreductase [Mycolicibacterium fallax]ORV04336.1 NAD(P)H nitroreductase [Mycolicibacterium fallax]BBY98524.1 NAD(P)H nitroreductase [Mycolicibacterium fallax]